MRVHETGMSRRRASVAQRGHHATGNVVLNTLSQHRLQSRRQKGSLQQLRVPTNTLQIQRCSLCVLSVAS